MVIDTVFVHDTMTVNVVRYPMAFATPVVNDINEQSEAYKTAMRGWLRLKGGEVIVTNHPPNGFGGGVIFGKIGATTKVIGYNVSGDDLSLLEGKEVTVMGEYSVTGVGEGTEYFCREITIFLHKD